MRRRGAVLEEAIFDAVIDELRSVGYTKLTMDGVAAVARTGKAALYRRWAGKDELVVAALRRVLPSPAAVPLTGRLADDLRALLRCMRAAFDSTHGAAFQVVKAEAGATSGLLHAVVHDRVIEPCQRMILEVLRQAAQAGEVRPDAVTPLVAGVGPAMLILRSMTGGADIPDDYVVHVVDQVILPLVRPQADL